MTTPIPTAAPTAHDAPAARVVAFFEALTPASVGALGDHYDPQARFKDPFNEVQGLADIRRIFEHMFVTLESPRFVVTQQVVRGEQCFLTWEFHFSFKNFKRGSDQVILGASHLVFSPAGLIRLHRDYWDAAEELYEKLPLVGSLMRWLKRRAGHP